MHISTLSTLGHRGGASGTGRSLAALLLAPVLLLAGCQTMPPEEPRNECPVVPECPVCAPQACPEPKVVEKEVIKYLPTPESVASDDAVGVVGAVEWAYVEPGGIFLEARIDTGAETSSIHAEDIQLLEKDGKRYVSFTLENPETGERIPLERRLHRRVLIKQTGDAESERRYVVRMWVTLDKKRTWLDVSLSDRDDFEYPLLLGRNMLIDEFVVDVARHHTRPRSRPESQ